MPGRPADMRVLRDTPSSREEVVLPFPEVRKWGLETVHCAGGGWTGSLSRLS